MKSFVSAALIAVALYLVPITPQEVKVAEQNYNYDVESLMKQPSYEDVFLLARLLKSEAYANEMADSVATVVLNRIYDKRHPNTLEGVIFEGAGTRKVQFDGVETENFNKAPENYYINAAKNALLLYENGLYYPTDVLYYYTTAATDKDFINSMKGRHVYTIQNTTFCKR
jgi:spore germination cell wall hydrolase CwlJ-like protein